MSYQPGPVIARKEYTVLPLTAGGLSPRIGKEVSPVSDSFTAANSLLQFTMSELWWRQGVLAQNLANVETPGYKRQDVAWSIPEVELAGQPGDPSSAAPGPFHLMLARTHPRHLDGTPATAEGVEAAPAGRLVRDTRTAVRNDGNNVDLERELVLVAETNLWYQSVTSLLASRYGMFRTALGTGR
ncbi:MAG: flagellar basal body rod protein FlgB [Limnochordaceae bacterium]|nr:flagellar basal body rod protein FlgB [Limnochordaceae bacterium]